jgi:hypothetical protein
MIKFLNCLNRKPFFKEEFLIDEPHFTTDDDSEDSNQLTFSIFYDYIKNLQKNWKEFEKKIYLCYRYKINKKSIITKNNSIDKCLTKLIEKLEENKNFLQLKKNDDNTRLFECKFYDLIKKIYTIENHIIYRYFIDESSRKILEYEMDNIFNILTNLTVYIHDFVNHDSIKNNDSQDSNQFTFSNFYDYIKNLKIEWKEFEKKIYSCYTPKINKDSIIYTNDYIDKFLTKLIQKFEENKEFLPLKKNDHTTRLFEYKFYLLIKKLILSIII